MFRSPLDLVMEAVVPGLRRSNPLEDLFEAIFPPSSSGDIGDEYDETKRPAEVIFFKSPLEGVASDRVEHSHHGLCFKFDGGRCISVGGTTNEEGNRLVPSYINGPPDKNSSGYPLDITINISPKYLWNCVRENKLNNTRYSLHDNNCQKWLRELAETLSSELSTTLRQRFPTLLEADPNTYFLLALLRAF